MKTTFKTLLLIVVYLIGGAGAEEQLTLEKIMQHPRWIGMWPEEVAFGPDGRSIFYLGHADPRGYEVVEINTRGEVIATHKTSSLPTSVDRLGERAISSFAGDLILSDPLSTRLTRTKAVEDECRWLGQKRFVFRSEGDYFIYDLATGGQQQVAELLFEEEPRAGKDFRSQQQDRLFPLLKEREEERAQRDLDEGIPRFYLGEDRQLFRLEVSPSQSRALLIHSGKSTKKPDQMPVYLNRDGSVKTESLRAKVGAVDPQDHRLALLDLRSGAIAAISLEGLPGYSSETKVFVEDTEWSSKGRLALSLFSEDFEERWLVEFDFGAAKVKLIEHLHDDAWHAWDLNEFGWTADGGSVWYQSEKTGYAHLYLWDGSTTRALTQGEFEVTSIHPSPDGRSFFYRSNQEDPGRYDVYRTNLSGQTVKITQLGGKTDFDLSPDGETLVLLHSTTASPPEISLQPARKGAKATQITHLASRDFLNIDWTLPRFVDIPSSHHSRGIRAKLYLPPDGVPRARSAVVFIHGAGYTQNADEGWAYYFREFMFHTLLSRQGVTVLDMDYRASAGYGRDWRTAIYRQMGTPELEDLKDGVAYLVKNEGIDPRQVGVYGGSYGGFLTLMALFKEPDLFACGAALRPVTDWAQYEHGYTARILNTPEEDPESYLRSSPIEFAEGLSKPLLMCHGMLDDNVVAQDTVRLTQRLIQLEKKNWEMALYPLEAHGFVEPESWLDEYRRIYKLFSENLEF